MTKSSAQDSRMPGANLRFEHLTVEDGISNNIITSVLQDSRGYVWIGTQEGLNRYDGYGIKVYRPVSGDSTSLSGEWVTTLHEGRDGTLWVGTDRDGLNRYDVETETFTRYQHREDDPTSLSFDGIFALHEGHDGMLWVGTAWGGLNRFDPEAEIFTRYRHRAGDPTSLSHDEINALFEGQGGILWVGTADGLNRFDPATQTFTRYKHRENISTSLSHDEINVLHEEHDGILWIGTEGGGLNRFDPATGTFKQYRHRAGDPASLSDDSILSLYKAQGALWIGTGGGGLNYFDLESEAFKAYQHQVGDPASLSLGEVSAVHTGPDGTLWVGTKGFGLNRAHWLTNTFTHHPLEKGVVLDVLEAEDGTLWVGTDGGLLQFDPKEGAFTVYEHKDGGLSSLNTEWVFALHQTPDGFLWMGTSDGLKRLDPETSTITSYHHKAGDPTSLSSNYVWSLHEGRDGVLWVGTYSGGLNRFDPQTGIFTSYQHREGDSTSLSNNDIWALHESHDGKLWVGTEGGGLNRFDPQSGTFTSYYHKAGDPTSLSDDRINVLYEACGGTLWIGASNGLNRLEVDPTDPKSASFKRFTSETSNFNGSVVFSIIEDERGMLWLGLGNGTLARFNPETGYFRFFGSREGIYIRGFEAASVYTRGGKIYKGGKGGLAVFDPAQIVDDLEPPRLYLTNLRLFNKLIEPATDGLLKAPLSETSRVELSHEQHDISIGFVGIHYAKPSGNLYNYRLRPYDRDWRGVTDQRRATYTALPPGNYTFEVKAANSDGTWTETPVALSVIIHSPWWRTTGAYLLYGLLFLGAIFTTDRFQRRRLIAREHEKAKERELEQAHKIEKAHIELQQSHEHLKATQLQLIQSEKMASLGELTAGIAHEIKNPLNFVNNFAEINERLAQELREAVVSGEDYDTLINNIERNAQVIKKHGKRADGIVHAMMQHASGGTGEYELTNINALVSEFIDLAYHGKRTQVPSFTVEIQRDLSADLSKAEVVPQEISRVFLNLFTNAFDAMMAKALIAEKDYRPTLYVTSSNVQTFSGEKQVEVRIKDNGPGVAAAILEKVFEPFFTTKPAGSGTGLGLSLSYDIVTQGHGGILKVESEVSQGATFIVTLPVNNATSNNPLATYK